MHINIDPSNGIPIYEQLVRQVKYSVAEGVVLPGQVIPSVREMAKNLAVNPNTVQRAYLRLQQEEILEPLRGRGMVVTSDAKSRCVSDRREIVASRFEDVIVEAASSGLDENQMREMFENALKSTAKTNL